MNIKTKITPQEIMIFGKIFGVRDHRTRLERYGNKLFLYVFDRIQLKDWEDIACRIEAVPAARNAYLKKAHRMMFECTSVLRNGIQSLSSETKKKFDKHFSKRNGLWEVLDPADLATLLISHGEQRSVLNLPVLPRTIPPESVTESICEYLSSGIKWRKELEREVVNRLKKEDGRLRKKSLSEKALTKLSSPRHEEQKEEILPKISRNKIPRQVDNFQNYGNEDDQVATFRKDPKTERRLDRLDAPSEAQEDLQPIVLPPLVRRNVIEFKLTSSYKNYAASIVRREDGPYLLFNKVEDGEFPMKRL